MIDIRPARDDEFDAIAHVWTMSWASVGIEQASPRMLAELRARIPREIAAGWSLYVATEDGRICAMLAFRREDGYLDQLFVAPEDQGKGLGRRLLAFTRAHLPNEIWLRCARDNEKAWRWYEREGFLLEREAMHPASGLAMKYYRWRR